MRGWFQAVRSAAASQLADGDERVLSGADWATDNARQQFCQDLAEALCDLVACLVHFVTTSASTLGRMQPALADIDAAAVRWRPWSCCCE